MSEIFAKQKELEQQSKRLATQVTKYINQTQQWLSLVDNFNHSLKELGDVKNWAQIMEHDMKTVMTTLEFVHQGNNDNTILYCFLHTERHIGMIIVQSG